MHARLLLLCALAINLALLACGPSSAASPPRAAAPATSAPAATRPATAAAAPTVAPAAAPTVAARQPLSPRVAVRYGDIGQASDAGFYLALDRGYFADEGLDVELQSVGSGGRMIPALGAGQIEAGGGGMSAALINAIAREVPLRIIADKGSLRKGFGYEAIIVRKELFDSGAVTSVADLRGRKVGLNSTASMDFYLLSKALEFGGLQLEDVQLEEVSFSDMVAALSNGGIDAAICLEPISTAILRQGIGSKLLALEEVVPDAQVGVIMYAPHFMRDQPAAATRFAIAYLRGVRDYNQAFTTGERKDEAIQTLTKYTSIKDPAVFNAMEPPGLNPNGHVNVDGLLAAQAFWQRRGLMPSVLPADAIVAPSYVDAALNALGRQ